MPDKTTKVIMDVTRRATMRYVWRLDDAGKVIVSQKNKSHSAELLDVSRTGFGLSVTERIEPGTVVSIEVSERGRKIELRGEIAHCRPTGDSWRCGCELITPLHKEELEFLLQTWGL